MSHEGLFPLTPEETLGVIQENDALRTRNATLEAVNAKLAAKLEASELARLCDSDITFVLNKPGMKLAFAEIQKAMKPDDMALLVFLDLNKFKDINHDCGHLQADNILAQYATHLVEQVRAPGDAVARYGGDEFVVMANLGAQPKDTTEFLRRLAAPIFATYSSSEGYGRRQVTSSIGLTIVTKDSDYLEALQLANDAALYVKHHNNRKGIGIKIPGPAFTDNISVIELPPPHTQSRVIDSNS